MQRASLRTLFLMLELLVAVIALQYVTMTRSVKADALWVATDFVAPPSAPACQVEDGLGS